jgi:hypothetical protein
VRIVNSDDGWAGLATVTKLWWLCEQLEINASRQKAVRAESTRTEAVHRRTETACTRHRDKVQSDMVVGSESCAIYIDINVRSTQATPKP